MQYEEEYHVQVHSARTWVTLDVCDTEREAIDSLNFQDDGIRSCRIIRTTQVTLIQRSRAK